eukprot:COSAG01_NODE_14892_length_1398_cov_1.022325_2_plen_203_part_00
MSRRSRLLLANSFYHIFNQANNKRGINLCNQTYDFFIDLLHHLQDKFHLNIYAYCLMTNHYHFLIKTERDNLDRAMADFGRNYACYINKITNGSGPVFNRRYQAKLITEERYLLQVLRYIHLNPVEADLCKEADSYDWSSFPSYIQPTQRKTSKKLIDTSFFLQRFLNIDDFIAFHKQGNHRTLLRYYNRKNTPETLSSDTI